MKMSRREFLILTAAFATSCSSVENSGAPAAGRERLIDAGPAGDYATDGVYSKFRNRGFFIVRRGEKLFALSAICTHKRCKLVAERDLSFYCPCHGSAFDADGKVLQGPARRDLPVFAVTTDENGKLLVTTPAT
jgi:Rieske Fe-S protein